MHGKYEEAIQAFNESIRLDPNFAKAWFFKGNALLAQGKNDEAIKAYYEAIRLDPNGATARDIQNLLLAHWAIQLNPMPP